MPTIFGQLTVVRWQDHLDLNDHVWKCICACGRTVLAQASNLRAGRADACLKCNPNSKLYQKPKPEPATLPADGARKVTNHGYVLVKICNSEWVTEHRLVMEQKLGRPLRKNERVRHLDGDRANNARENLLPYYQGGPPSLEAAIEHAEIILKLRNSAKNDGS